MPGEAEFRRWFVTNAAKQGWLAQSIEASTGAGIPDVFMCRDGRCAWAELKSTESSKVYMRISQFRWFVKFHDRGGKALLIIKRLKTRQVDVYSATNLRAFSDAQTCQLRGKDIYFPDDVKPVITYKLGTNAATFFEDIHRVI